MHKFRTNDQSEKKKANFKADIWIWQGCNWIEFLELIEDLVKQIKN
jgi:hypothetical protein